MRPKVVTSTVIRRNENGRRLTLSFPRATQLHHAPDERVGPLQGIQIRLVVARVCMFVGISEPNKHEPRRLVLQIGKRELYRVVVRPVVMVAWFARRIGAINERGQGMGAQPLMVDKMSIPSVATR